MPALSARLGPFLSVLLVATTFAAARDTSRDPVAEEPNVAPADRLDDDRPRPERRYHGEMGFRRPGFGMGFPAQPPRDVTYDTVDTGFVFVDGEYVSIPYVFRRENGILYVNDLRITPEKPDEKAEGQPWGRRSEPQSVDEWTIFLSDDAVIWIERGRARLLNRTADGYVLLKHVLVEGHEVSELDAGMFPDDLREWATGYSPPDELVARAVAQTEKMERIWHEEKTAASAQKMIEKIQYPMTMVAMLLAAAAVGHLFTSWPRIASGEATDAGETSLRSRIVWRSMAFVVALSVIDLVWTVLSWQAGTMREINPLAEQFISSPLALSFFKIVATGIGITLLVCLRRYHSAQTASLWLCLVCTLLTVRWLTFHSLFTT